jgi:hypothetical protein
VLEIELWSEPKNQKTAGAAVQSHDTAAVLSRPCKWTMRARARPVFFAGPVACGTPICSLVVCLLGLSQLLPRLVCWYYDVRKNHTYWKTVGKLEGRRSQVGTNKITSWMESR